jgi:DNA-binding MarR family transcriptional regulator
MERLGWFKLERFYGQYGCLEMLVASYILHQEEYFIKYGKILPGDEVYMTLQEIATATFMSKATVNRTLNTLVDRKVISRKRGQNKMHLRIIIRKNQPDSSGKNQPEPCEQEST